MAILKVYSGSSWVTAIGKVYDGAAWKEKMGFYDGTDEVPLYPLPVAVSMVGGTHSRTRLGGACWANIEFRTDGVEWWSVNTGGMTINKGAWLDLGGVSDVYIERTIDSGSLDRDDTGASRLILSVTRGFGVVRTLGEGDGTDTCTFTVRMYDAAVGGHLLQTMQYTVSATKTSL